MLPGGKKICYCIFNSQSFYRARYTALLHYWCLFFPLTPFCSVVSRKVMPCKNKYEFLTQRETCIHFMAQHCMWKLNITRNIINNRAGNKVFCSFSLFFITCTWLKRHVYWWTQMSVAHPWFTLKKAEHILVDPEHHTDSIKKAEQYRWSAK